MNLFTSLSPRAVRHLSVTTRFVALATILLLCASREAHAANITWGGATLISGDANVQNTGTKIGAFNLGDTNTLGTNVNGVTFDAFAVSTTFVPGSTTVGNFTLAFSGGVYGNDTVFGSTSNPFNNLSTSYKTLLQSGVGDTNNGTITLTMAGLTSGTNYSFQWWANDAGYAVQTPTVTATSGNAVTLDPNNTNADGGLGQFATGTFTANSTSQIVTFSTTGTNTPLLNAFQLRDLTVAPVPEPSTWAMMALGVGALGLTLRRKREGERDAA